MRQINLEPIGRAYKVIQDVNGKYLAAMIISEHDSCEEAVEATLEAMNKESEEISKREIEELREKGIKAVRFEDAIKDMTPEELEGFLEERKRKFLMPLMDKNIEMLEQKSKRCRIKRIK
ncbi:MAG: hypothetical protein PHE70_10725 [Tepidanaerobacteraceae bacterium]|nr:hypothetical protein [Tepidanaerobacteraceae bacterium]HHV19174.1 hypothetical protein [Thermoanaerobacterales bacterium]